MLRRIIEIDTEKCNGCGACASACHEGAIGMVNGKAKLLREDFCDGLGDCLPACPADAIHFVEREAPAYDAEAVQASQAEIQHAVRSASRPVHRSGCPGSALRQRTVSPLSGAQTERGGPESRLTTWPVQLRLLPVRAAFFTNADLLLAADCTAFSYGDFHRRFLDGRIPLIACPKLDDASYTEKLCAIFRENPIRSVTVVRMEVPCCGGLVRAAEEAVRQSGRSIPLHTVVITTDGNIAFI